MTEDQYTDSADVSQPEQRIAELEQRIDQLEATMRKMLPGRRDAMKLGGAAVIGAAAMSGTASAGSSQVGTIGDSNNLVDIEAEDVNVSDSINGASVSGAAAGEALTSDGAGGLSFASVGGGIPANFTYLNESSNRSFGTTFTNNTGKALYVVITGITNTFSSFHRMRAFVNGVIIIDEQPFQRSDDYNDGMKTSIQFFVPDGATYRVLENNLDVDIWFEAEM